MWHEQNLSKTWNEYTCCLRMILYDVFSVSEETGGAGDRGRRWWLAKYCGRVVSGWPRESSNQLTGCRFRARATEKNTRNSVSIKQCKLLAVISTTKFFLLIFTRNFALLLEKFEFVLCLVVSKPFFVQCNLDHQFCRRSPHQTPCARVAHKDSTFALHRLEWGCGTRHHTPGLPPCSGPLLFTVCRHLSFSRPLFHFLSETPSGALPCSWEAGVLDHTFHSHLDHTLLTHVNLPGWAVQLQVLFFVYEKEWLLNSHFFFIHPADSKSKTKVKVVVSPVPPNQCWKNHLIINIVSGVQGGGGRTCLVSQQFRLGLHWINA